VTGWESSTHICDRRLKMLVLLDRPASVVLIPEACLEETGLAPG
jgi:hypothetical protein